LLREYMFIQPLTRDGRCSVFHIRGNSLFRTSLPWICLQRLHQNQQ
jgi:hypothetical protein